jgi:hypothetical protein
MRWFQPDTIIPNPYDPQSWDRYSFVRNNPLRFVDPSGHDVDCSALDGDCKRQVKIEKRIEYLDQEKERCSHAGGENCPDYVGYGLTALTVIGLPGLDELREGLDIAGGGMEVLKEFVLKKASQCTADATCRAILFALLGYNPFQENHLPMKLDLGS